MLIPGRRFAFTEQSIVCPRVKIDQRCETFFIVRKPSENAFFAVTGGDQPMSIVLKNRRDFGNHCPPRRTSSSCRTRMSAGIPPLIT